MFTSGLYSRVEKSNLTLLEAFIRENGADYLTGKVINTIPHGGDAQLAADSLGFSLLTDFVSQVTGVPNTKITLPETVNENRAATLRRASLLLAGKIPPAAALERMETATDEDLRDAIRQLMNDSNFHNFLTTGANDQLQTRSLKQSYNLSFALENYYPWYAQLYFETPNNFAYLSQVSAELAEAPLELIAWVIEHNRPYTEIVTAPFGMVSKHSARFYETDLTVKQGEFVPAQNFGQRVSNTALREPSHNWNNASGVAYPHSGVLTDIAFLQQFPTTATNRNRARARWTYQLFLGVDIENSAARNIDSSLLTNITVRVDSQIACAICHERLDAVAGAFQNFSDRSVYKDSSYGRDSLAESYKATNYYRLGDTWYNNMPAAGLERLTFDTAATEDPAQQLGKALAADPRFAQGAVKFWWPAIFGTSPESAQLNDADNKIRATSIAAFAQHFREQGFDFKTLLTNMIMSPWFRADPEKINPYRQDKHLLTPEELYNKTASLTGIKDPRLLDDWNLLYGGIDSYNVEKRQRDFTAMMMRVAGRLAASNACAMVTQDFARPAQARQLFTDIELDALPDATTAEQTLQINTQFTKQLTTLIERFWGASHVSRTAELVDLFTALRANALSRQQNNVQDNCNLPAGSVLPPEAMATAQVNLAAWRSLLVLLMTDYHYLHE